MLALIMIYTIPTIQHTGTKLLAKLFGDVHWASFYEDIGDRESALYLGHLTINSVEAIKKLKHRMIIPLRHPYLVAESWRRRNKPLDELADNFRLLVDEIDPYNPLYLPIDVENRQEYLDKINKELGLDLRTEWGVENSKKSTYNLSYKELSPGPVEKALVEDIKEFLKRFY